MDRLVTLHVVRERRGRQPLVMARMLTDRLRLRRVDGLRFVRVLGTGRGSEVGLSADLTRQVYVCVWAERSALERFLGRHAISARWRRLDGRHDELRLVDGHGTWSGVDVLSGVERATAEDVGAAGGVVVVTRASVRPRSWRAFHRSARRVAVELRTAPGLVDVMGVGELPVGFLGTISTWSSSESIEAFRRRPGVHADAMSRPWLSESLFARFVARPIPFP